MKLTTVLSFAAFAVLTVTITQTSDAASIGVNFTGDAWLLQPTDQPGVVAGANWNNVNGGSGTNVPLQNNTGTATAALLTFNSTSSLSSFNPPSTANAATNLLYHGGIFGDNATREVTLSLTNIPYSSYDVYVYASQDTINTNTLSITDGITTFYYRSSGQTNNGAPVLLETTSTNPLSPTSGSAQYQVFGGLTNSSLNLTTGGSTNLIISNNVFGFQVVETPEPTSAALLVSTLALGLLRRPLRTNDRNG